MGTIGLLASISFLISTAQFVIAGILDRIAVSMGVPIAAAGQLMTVSSLANALGTPLVMVVAAAVDRRKLILIALGAMFMSMMGTALLPSFRFLVACRVLLGVGFCVFGVCSYTIAVQLAPPGRQAGAVAQIAMGASLALVVGVPAGRVVSAAFDWQWVFFGIGLLMLGALAGAVRAIPATEGRVSPRLSQQGAYLKQPRIAAALGVAFTMFISFAAMNTYIVPFLTDSLDPADGVVSGILLGLGIASTIGAKLGGALADRMSVGSVIIVGLAVQTLALGLVSVIAPIAAVTIPLLMLWALAAWTVGPMLSFNLISLAPGAAGILLSLNGSFIQMGFATGAAVGGVAVSGGSLSAISWTATTAAGVATLIACLGCRSKGALRPAKDSQTTPTR